MAPSGARARFTANLAAISTAKQIQAEGRPATAAEQAVLARWGSWGAIPQVFDEKNTDWAQAREQLKEALDPDAYKAARLTTINAHYTDPTYVKEIWGALEGLGFTGGDVLEPGSGAGTFIGMAPESARMVGVELDATTAGIAAGLYPQATIRAESFADTRFPHDHFDAAVGNVPFADVSLYDPAFNPNGHSIHNHFIVKSLAMTRPGGMVAVLTSSFTLDAVNPAARREMNEMADLVGAVRLPAGAHRRAAGTEAVTDLLIFRKREPGVPPRDVLWETVSARQVDEHMIKVNSYFDVHPENVLGYFHIGRGMYGNETVSVRAEDLTQTAGRLHEALTGIVGQAQARGEVFTEASVEAVQERHAAVAAQTQLWDGSIVAVDGGGFQVAAGGHLDDLAVSKTQHKELRALLGLRDGARVLLDAEASSADDTDTIEDLRQELRDDYESYVAAYGPINRFTLRSTGRYETVQDPITGETVMDPQTGQSAHGDEILARITPSVMRVFKTDPYSARVHALERFDEEDQHAAPASMLLHRVVTPRTVTHGAETPAEALAVSMDETGSADLELIAHLLGTNTDEARAGLGQMVYDEPGTGRIVAAPEYLSGNVRSKLEAAQEAADADERFRVNVSALEKVIPSPIGIEEIEARLGAVWISPEIHRQFLQEILNDRTVKVENPLPGQWEVRGIRYGMRATNEWGTPRRPATDLAQSLMEQSRIVAKDKIDGSDGKQHEVVNPVETTAAQEKADALQERFGSWVWEDPQRAASLGEEYNRRFNSIALRDYTQAGDYLSLPGFAADITLRPHQRAAVARMIAEPAVGLFHQVGAGKTLEMIAGATEQKRMGLIRKPAVVVPNHMLEQFSREWLQAYPNARILAASSKDLSADKRRLFIARVAANDWDAVVMTQSAFKRMGMSAGFRAQYIEQEVGQLRAALEDARDADAMSVKRIEKAILSAEQQYKKQLDIPHDRGVNFEDTGIDYLIVDEMHMYKNLKTPSKISDAAIDGSEHATDLHMKLEYLRSKYGDRVITGATATPLSNSVTEAYVMQRYLRPDLLVAAGVTSFDGWAATFGSQVTEMEMGPAGGFRLKTRFAKFQNVPEMLRMWHVFADVKTAEDLNLPTPKIAARRDGKREVETIVLEPTAELEEYIAHIADRAERVANKQVDQAEDNMLLISTDGRKAALDLRLVDEDTEPTGPVKLDAVATQITRVWKATANNTYLDEVTGEPSPLRGGLQLVFCDLSTPNPNRWDAYTELKSKLVQAGIAPDAIRFIHDAKNDNEKARLFAAARAGHVSVLIGSTGKMGVGTNVQTRLTALHHVDCPWRPSDLEQRDGRGIRQGNQNAEVGLYRYVVERSFDAYSWQTVSRKAKFINQVTRGRLDVREIEDIGDTALSASEAKALASGNPLVLEKATADNAYQKLRRQEVAYHRSQAALSATRAGASAAIEGAQADIDKLRAANVSTVDVAGDKFTMTIDGHTYTSRADTAAALTTWANTHVGRLVPGRDPVPLGSVGGHTVTVGVEVERLGDYRRQVVARFALENVPYSGSGMPVEDVAEAGIGLVRQLENKTTAIARSIASREKDRTQAEHTLQEAEGRLGQPFKHADALREAEVRVTHVNQQLAEEAKKEPSSAESTNTDSPETRGNDEADPRRLVRRRPADPNTGPVTGPGPASVPSFGRG